MAEWLPIPKWDDNTVADGTDMNAPAMALEARTDFLKEHTPTPFVTGESYALNRRVQLDNGDIVKSTIDGNTSDPNVDMTGWVNTNTHNNLAGRDSPNAHPASAIYDSLLKENQENINKRNNQLNLNPEIFYLPSDNGDYTRAINEAIVFAKNLSYNNNVYLEQKSYDFSGVINVTNGVKLIGKGVTKTFLKAISSGAVVEIGTLSGLESLCVHGNGRLADIGIRDLLTGFTNNLHMKNVRTEECKVGYSLGSVIPNTQGVNNTLFENLTSQRNGIGYLLGNIANSEFLNCTATLADAGQLGSASDRAIVLGRTGTPASGVHITRNILFEKGIFERGVSDYGVEQIGTISNVTFNSVELNAGKLAIIKLQDSGYLSLYNPTFTSLSGFDYISTGGQLNIIGDLFVTGLGSKNLRNAFKSGITHNGKQGLVTANKSGIGILNSLSASGASSASINSINNGVSIDLKQGVSNRVTINNATQSTGTFNNTDSGENCLVFECFVKKMSGSVNVSVFNTQREVIGTLSVGNNVFYINQNQGLFVEFYAIGVDASVTLLGFSYTQM